MNTAPDPSQTDPAHATVAVSIDGRIAEDKFCIECGYNLRTLHPSAKCPECAQPVADSLKGQQLEFASIPWLRTVRRGFQLLKLASIVGILWILSAMFLGLGAPVLLAIVAWSTIPVSLLVFGAAIVGFVLATRVEPRVAYRGEGLSARKLTRISAYTAAALGGGLELLALLGPKNAVVDVIVMIVPLIVRLTAVLAACAFVQYVINLLERTGETRTLKSARQARGVVLFTIALVAVSWMSTAVIPLFPNISADAAERLKTVSRASRGISSCSTLIFAIAALVLIGKVATILGRTLVAAESKPADQRQSAGEHPAS